MTPAEIYAMPTDRHTSELYDLTGDSWHHLEELSDLSYNVYNDFDTTERLSVRTVKYFDFDGRRCWALRTVWLDDKPVMITQNAGREGDDHVRRYITDAPLFLELLEYIRSRRRPQEPATVVTIDMHKDAPEISVFWGYDLTSTFERHDYR